MSGISARATATALLGRYKAQVFLLRLISADLRRGEVRAAGMDFLPAPTSTPPPTQPDTPPLPVPLLLHSPLSLSPLILPLCSDNGALENTGLC